MSQAAPAGTIIIAMIGLIAVMFMFVAIWAARYVKCAPNQVLVVSGRRMRRPDGSTVGYRIVQGGGTFVMPIIERSDVLSLEVVSLDLRRARPRAANGIALIAEGTTQFKIKNDPASLAAAAEQLLNKDQAAIREIVWNIFEKQLGVAVSGYSADQLNQNPGLLADRLQSMVATDLDKMGIGVANVIVREIKNA